jgi:acetate kinase
MGVHKRRVPVSIRVPVNTASPAAVLVVNAGSSSLKLAVADSAGAVRERTVVSGLHGSDTDFGAALLKGLKRISADDPVVVGHRVVHGGSHFSAPVVIDNVVMTALHSLVHLSPLHQLPCLAAIDAARHRFPDATHVAVFDTAFHRCLPELATRFALPRDLHDAGIRRFGFHGLSYESIAKHLRADYLHLFSGRVGVAHLGSGSSLCGMLAGQSYTTTMGYTPLDGLPMATRPGRLDPGVVLELLRSHNLSVSAVEDLLHHRCGLLGISGISGDVRELLRSDRGEAREAIDYLCAAIAREMAALACDLGGLDAIVFTAGIGENSPEIRAEVTKRLRWLDVAIDHDRNLANARDISAPDSQIPVLVLPADEASVIAGHSLTAIDRN